jgi:S-adenosylhomocysteine hydrolase
MKFLIHQIGKVCPEGMKKALEMLNTVQTVWRTEFQSEIERPASDDPGDYMSAIPDGTVDKSFVIGVTARMVEQKNKLSLVDHSAMKALISEYQWYQLRKKNYDPPEVFWALALANVCFRCSINESCDQEDCLGFKDYTVDNLLIKLLELRICSCCEKKALAKYKYQFSEFKKLLDILKKPKEYGEPLPFKKPQLEVLNRQTTRQIKKGITSTFDGYGIIIVMHFLEDLIPFLEGLITLGAKKESITLVIKPYPYSQRSVVHSYLYTNHPEIVVEYLSELPPPNDTLKELVETCRSRSPLRKILVIEDGGYVVPFLHKNYSREDAFCIGAVEQTTKGLRKDEDVEKAYKERNETLYFPVMNVAKSNFKDEYEAPLVGRAVISSIQRLLNDESFFGEKALVIGFGAVGREVANALKEALGMIVRVSDSKRECVAAARVRGFEAAVSPVELVRDAKLIIGTTGRQSIGHDILEKLENGTILVSSSSDLIEIDIEHLGIMAPEQRYEEGLGTWCVRKEGLGEDTYLLLGDGFPVNFYSGSGIPNKAIDPILAQLFIGAMHLAKEHGKLPHSILNVMDDLIEEYELLQDFLDIHAR